MVRYAQTMLLAVRILAILFVTLGFQIHGVAGAVKAATSVECALVVAADPDAEPGQAVPDKPSPSCKLIGTSAAGPVQVLFPVTQALRPIAPEIGFAAIWPRGPEKPPKAG